MIPLPLIGGFRGAASTPGWLSAGDEKQVLRAQFCSRTRRF
jgi:hypothetical protein